MPKNTLKIALVVDDGLDRLDGVQKYTVTIGNYFASLGHEVHYLCGETKRLDIDNIHSLSRNMSVHSNGGNQLTIPLPASKKAIAKVLDKENFDVIHVQTPYSPFLAGRIIEMAHQRKIPIVGTFHILPFSPWLTAGSYLLGFVQQPTIKKFDEFWSVSEPAQEFAKRCFRINSEVLPNPVVIDDFKPKAPRKRNDNTIVHLAYLNRLVKRKGCMELLQALKWALDSGKVSKRVHLDICSDGYDRQRLEKFVYDNQLNDIVDFRGYVSDNEKAEYLQRADIAVFPSLGGESFGIVLIEAMASQSGVVIGGNNPGYSSVLKSEEVLFDPKDTQNFGQLLVDLINDSAKRQRLHNEQQKMVLQFDITKVGDEILKAYTDLQNTK